MPQQPFNAKAFLSTVTTSPGVYRMLGENDRLLYVGKARNLKNRLSSYFTKGAHSAKTIRMLMDVRQVEVTLTHTENEALILESTLIKTHKPPYNILLKDDKSYPFVFVSGHQYPRIALHRGAQRAKGRYFGPYPNAWAVRESLAYLQKLFQLRPCDDNFFKNRSRPCLQYQIKRCSGPCVQAISAEDYAEEVENALRFLDGRNEEITDALAQKMEAAAEQLDFEQAATLRDRIRHLRRVQERQYVSGGKTDADVIAPTISAGRACVVVMSIRSGRQLGHKAFHPKLPADATLVEVLADFVPQYYANKPVPPEVLLTAEIPEQEFVAAALSDHAGHKVVLKHKLRSDRARWLHMAQKTAEQAIASRLAMDANLQQRFESLQEVFDLEELPQRLECFDISHSQGEAAVASCVVFDHEGAKRADYRRFNIADITPGDDYAAIHQAVLRRYKRLREGEAPMPDILLIDGGKGQLAQALDALESLQINGLLVVGVAKGPTRKAGKEQLFLPHQSVPLILPEDTLGLHLIQQIRDEAHRFALTGHRQRRDNSRKSSSLENISGLGPKRRQQLLRHFGGLQAVTRSGVDDLVKVPGISRTLAQTIYDRFHA